MKDRTLNAGTAHVQARATFGRCFGTGKFGDLLDTVDDVVFCATSEWVPTPAVPDGVSNVGAAYPFHDSGLAPLSGAEQIFPPTSQIQEDLGLGVLDVEIGNVRGAGFANLVFVAAAHAETSLSGVNGIGAVDVYDMTGSLAPFDPTQVVLELVPPVDPAVAGGCPNTVTPAARFGHSIAIADVDGDGTNDLVIGASSTSEADALGDCSRNLHGRVYIFFGHQHFFDEHYPNPSGPKGYLWRWAAIKAPQLADPTSPYGFVKGGEFGLSLDADDLDGDGRAEVLAGRAERNLDRGRAHLFFGAWIAAQLPPETYPPLGFALLIEPPHTTDKNAGMPGAYETLIDKTQTDLDLKAFGFNVFMLRRDVGSCASGCDGRKDIAIHSYFSDFLGSSHNPATVSAGALFIFFNNASGAPGTSSTLVDEDQGVKIQRPWQAGAPQTDSRFGFVAKAISWATLSGTPALATYLLVGEPLAANMGQAESGRVYMLGTPIDPSPSLKPDEHPNMLGAPLTDPSIVPPASPQPMSRFGSWIGVLDYAIDPALYPGQEFIVSSRGRNVTLGGTTYALAGQAYSYRSAP